MYHKRALRGVERVEAGVVGERGHGRIVGAVRGWIEARARAVSRQSASTRLTRSCTLLGALRRRRRRLIVATMFMVRVVAGRRSRGGRVVVAVCGGGGRVLLEMFGHLHYVVFGRVF